MVILCGESYPTNVRGAGYGYFYAVGGFSGAVAPFLIDYFYLKN